MCAKSHVSNADAILKLFDESKEKIIPREVGSELTGGSHGYRGDDQRNAEALNQLAV